MNQIVQNLTNKITSSDFLEKHRHSEIDFTRRTYLPRPKVVDKIKTLMSRYDGESLKYVLSKVESNLGEQYAAEKELKNKVLHRDRF